MALKTGAKHPPSLLTRKQQKKKNGNYGGGVNAVNKGVTYWVRMVNGEEVGWYMGAKQHLGPMKGKRP